MGPFLQPTWLIFLSGWTQRRGRYSRFPNLFLGLIQEYARFLCNSGFIQERLLELKTNWKMHCALSEWNIPPPKCQWLIHISKHSTNIILRWALIMEYFGSSTTYGNHHTTSLQKIPWNSLRASVLWTPAFCSPVFCNAVMYIPWSWLDLLFRTRNKFLPPLSPFIQINSGSEYLYYWKSEGLGWLEKRQPRAGVKPGKEDQSFKKNHLPNISKQIHDFWTEHVTRGQFTHSADLATPAQNKTHYNHPDTIWADA